MTSFMCCCLMFFFRAYETSLLVDQEISSEIPYNGKYLQCVSVCNLYEEKDTNKTEVICAMNYSDLNFRKFILINANGTA